ncbi:hypothetical protein PanWU01x14_121060, partial [Parasponia andersonii]
KKFSKIKDVFKLLGTLLYVEIAKVTISLISSIANCMIMKILVVLLVPIFVALLASPVTEGKKKSLSGFDDDRRHNLRDHQPIIHHEHYPNGFGRKVLNSAEVANTDEDDDQRNTARDNTNQVGSDTEGEWSRRKFIGKNKTANNDSN